jgi:quinohemoprotein ethanol dehydrogenase
MSGDTGSDMARSERRKSGWYGAFLDAGIWVLFALLLLPAGLVGYAIGKDQASDEPATTAEQAADNATQTPQIEPAPAFSAEQLSEEPKEAWLTNGGTLSNQRYSPLDEIDTDNVGDLKGVWMTDLSSSGVAAKYSAEAQPIVYQGVMYVPTGADDVFAVSVETGKVLWRYEAKLDQKISTVCCGWLSRGVALGDGKVYLGQLDGSLVALDQRTGKLVWSAEVGSWQQGYTITAAPLYYDGMVVTGVSGGEFSIRGRVQAYDAKTGKEVWRFHTVPGPGEKGHDTWPQDNDSWEHGGAPVWQTPAVDPELGLMYFSTGNASPDLDGSRRKGDNLFAASIVAVDAKTGEYRWHFQQVHHDIWDYDSPSPVVLFDVEIDGEERKGIAEASKTGWLYLLDRETGKPLLPIEEKAVPQLAGQATAKTQPIPSYPPFFSHEVTDEDVAAIQKLADANAKNGATKPKVVKGGIYTPFGETITAIVPGPQGGTNWQPTSYNPETGMFYVCAMRSVSGYSSKNEELPAGKRGQTADLGSVFTTTGFGSQEGHFLAIEASTGEIKWQKRWPESCYSGSVTTGGNLVFVGRNGGQLEAYNAETGEGPLWSFQTGAGANTTATVFEQDGTQYLAFLAGGNALAATQHGDNLWLFSLAGSMDEVAAGGGGEGTGHAGQSPNEPTDEVAGDASAGAAVWSDNCAGCHGTNGTGANGGPNLVGNEIALDPAKVRAQVTNGGGGMPAFKDTLTTQQINDVTAYVTQEIATKG